MSKIIAHLVPMTNYTGKAIYKDKFGILSLNPKERVLPADWQAQQLVITDDSDIKKGDKMLLEDGHIANADEISEELYPSLDEHHRKRCPKIIAVYPLIDNIPLPTDEFIAEWVRCQGKCEVEVEMEDVYDWEKDDKPMWSTYKFTDGKLCLKCIPERVVTKETLVDSFKEIANIMAPHLENESPIEHPPSEEKDVEEAATIALPYPDPKTYRVFNEHMAALHQQIDAERRLWIQGYNYHKQRSEKDVADFQKKIKDANGEFDNFINWLDEQERYKNVYIEYLNVNGNQ